MGDTKPDIVVISDFNSGNLITILNNHESGPRVNARAAPFGQVYPPLLDPQHECWEDQPNLAVVWTQPQGISPTFRKAQQFNRVDLGEVLAEVDSFADALLKLAGRLPCVLVPTWVVPTCERGWGMQDLRNGIGVANLLARMNLRLADRVDASQGNLFQLNSQQWIERAGRDAFQKKLWYMAKVPFGDPVFREAVLDIKAAILGISGQAKKLVIVDLDDTLWGGIVGDVGWDNLRLGGHDPVGESFADFQRGLKALTCRGVLLAIASKNEEKVAIEAIERHPEMQVSLADFSAWRINWNDKARNILEIVDELNLGLQSTVFIDDSPAERNRVREALPEVFVPEWPHDKLRYPQFLAEMRCFDVPSVSQEDLARTAMYAAEKSRENLKREVTSLDEWFKRLGITIHVEELKEANLSRATQLLNKTNQMNLTGRRMSESELKRWTEEEGHRLWTFRVNDRFGDSGLTGVVSLEIRGPVASIVDFVLSCRVFGRKVEEAMLFTAIRHARACSLTSVEAICTRTAKNMPTLEFWHHRSGFDTVGDADRFVWPLTKDYELPEGIELIPLD